MTEPGAPTSALPPLAAITATSRDRLGRRRRHRLRCRPGRLRTPERASAPPHNRAAPRGASRHARTRGPAPALPRPVPPLINMQAWPGGALALSGGRGSAGASGASPRASPEPRVGRGRLGRRVAEEV